MKKSTFRNWILQKWFEHRDEIESYERRLIEDSPEEYFQKSKWFLKRLYKDSIKYDSIINETEQASK